MENTKVITDLVNVLVDLEKIQHSSLKPDSYSRLIDKVLAQLNSELDNTKGKKFVVDLATIPKSMSFTEWLKYADNLNIHVIDTTPKEKRVDGWLTHMMRDGQAYYEVPVEKRYTIPDFCRGFRNGESVWIVPQDHSVPQRYWGLVVKNKIISWYEE